MFQIPSVDLVGDEGKRVWALGEGAVKGGGGRQRPGSSAGRGRGRVVAGRAAGSRRGDDHRTRLRIAELPPPVKRLDSSGSHQFLPFTITSPDTGIYPSRRTA